MNLFLKTTIIIINLALCSCATSSEWKEYDVSPIKRRWRQCDERHDGNLANKGFCRHQKQCKKLLIGKKCKKVKMFCRYDDMECKRKEQIDRMILSTKESI